MKRCAHCRTPFEPRFSTLQACCGPDCARAWVKANPDRAERLRKRAAAQERREHRLRTQTPRGAAKEAQEAFNEWIRERDRGLPCVSCGHPDDGSRKRNAGHFRPAGSNPALRFNEANVWGQCERCNSFESGNLVGYRVELVRRIGAETVAWLEGPHPLPKRTVDDFRAIEREYKRRLAEGRKGRAA